MFLLFFSLLLCTLHPSTATIAQNLPQAQPQDSHSFKIVEITDGLQNPWAMAFLPNNQGILITEKGGTVRLVDGNGNLLPAPLSGPLPSVWNAGQGGLLDVAIAPDFDSSQYIYFTYAKLFDQQQGATTAVARAKLNFPSNGGDPFFTDLEDIFVADAFSPFSIHFGSRIVFDFKQHNA